METMIVAVLLLSLLSASSQQELVDEHCGQYGFRCVDSESYQICTFTDLDGQTEAPEIVRKCFDHNVCDEDNPAYCTPQDRIENESEAKSSGKCQKKVFGKRSHSGNYLRKNEVMPVRSKATEFRDLNLRNSDNNPFGFDNDDNDIETTTTTESDDYPTFNNQKFECESFGYFPDIYNASMFWHCDHQNKGKGFIVRHMLCSSGRVFNPVHKECVMIGTTRNIRHNFDLVTSHKTEDPFRTKQIRSYKIEPELKVNPKFSCRNRLPGKYADRTSCRIYHYCLPRGFAPFNELTFICPNHLAYDADRETCNRISYERCAERLHPHENKILHIVVDAIVLQKQNCKRDLRRHSLDFGEYHLCHNDDLVLHMKCPDSYHFDENLLTCLP